MNVAVLAHCGGAGFQGGGVAWQERSETGGDLRIVVAQCPKAAVRRGVGGDWRGEVRRQDFARLEWQSHVSTCDMPSRTERGRGCATPSRTPYTRGRSRYERRGACPHVVPRLRAVYA